MDGLFFAAPWTGALKDDQGGSGEVEYARVEQSWFYDLIM